MHDILTNYHAKKYLSTYIIGISRRRVSVKLRGRNDVTYHQKFREIHFLTADKYTIKHNFLPLHFNYVLVISGND